MEDRRYGVEVKSLLESPSVMAFTLYLVMQKQYGDDWLSWEPLTVYLELREDFSCEPSVEAMDRLNAVQMLMTSSAFFDDLYGFMGTCNTLADGSPSFDLLDPATSAEIAWAMTEVGLMREMEPFAPTIVDYVKTMLEMEGIDDDVPEILADIVAPSPNLDTDAAGYANEVLRSNNKDKVELFVDDQLGLIISQLTNLELGDQFLTLLAEA